MAGHWFRAEAEIPLRVTFDTNTFDKVSRPSVYPNDAAHADMVEIHEALRRGDVQGFVSDTALTLEGIGVDHRATVFGGTIARSSMAQTSDDTFTITITPEQPDRRPVHHKQAERFREAFGLGIRLLGAPRIGMPRAEEEFYAVEDPTQLGERLDRYFNLAREIERRGLGCRRAEVLAVRLAAGAPSSGPWFTSLGNAHDIHETREVGRAIAEWADGDSVAAHYAYGNDFFCTLDAGTGESKRGDPAILDATNRAWLTAQFGVQFATISELAGKFRK
jgi:hypothetical protein